MSEQEMREKLRKLDQLHLLRYWDDLSSSERSGLERQIASLDPSLLDSQRKVLAATPPIPSEIEPFLNFSCSGNAADKIAGRKLMAEGALGCLLIAGGQGSRLRLEGPKGLFPITAIKHKPLFQLFAEKVKAASKLAGRPLPLAIMTSPQNHEQTVQFFEQHQNFSLEKDQLFFFSQEEMPLLNFENNWFLENPSKVSLGPDGNGGALYHFYESGCWERWQSQGIRYLNVILVDNPLADPYDAELLGFAQRTQKSVILKCTKRQHAEEKVGVVVNTANGLAVIEYTEMLKTERERLAPDGSLAHLCANLSLFCFSMGFVKEVSSHYRQMPLHYAKKAVRFVAENGQSRLAEEPNAWKFEKFIFDLITSTQSVAALLYPREECFAPLKSLEGENGVESVKNALLSKDRAVFEQLTGVKTDQRTFELSQEFYYPTAEMISRWKGKSLPDEAYIVD